MLILETVKVVELAIYNNKKKADQAYTSLFAWTLLIQI